MSTNIAFRPGSRFLHLALVDAAGNLPVALALDGELLQPTAFQHGHAPLEALAGDYDFLFVALFLKTEKPAYFV